MAATDIAVTGATGQQGGAVVRALLDRGYTVRGITRNMNSDRAAALARAGVELVSGDFEVLESMKKAFQGVATVFLMSTPFEGGVETETRQGIQAVEAAEAVGVRHIVFTSVANADQNTGIPHFDSKYKVEQHLQSNGTPYTIIAPAFFYQNMLSPFVLPGLQQGTLAQALPVDRKLQCVSTETIGSFAAHVAANRNAFLGAPIDLAGDALPGTEFVAVLSRVSGKTIDYKELPLEQLRDQSEDMALMYDWFNRVGYSIDIEGLKKAYPEVRFPDFKEWAQAQDWSVLNS